MRVMSLALALAFLSAPGMAQTPTASPATATQAVDPVAVLVGRLDLERYKATIKGLTAFGDRRQGTERNRKAVDWIEAQLRSYGCGDVDALPGHLAGAGTGQGGQDPHQGGLAGAIGSEQAEDARTQVQAQVGHRLVATLVAVTH